MGIAYLSFSLILGLFLIWFCVKTRMSKWWGLLIFVIPLTAPILMFKSQAAKKTIFTASIIIGFVITLGMEVSSYKEYKEKTKYSHLPPIVQEMIRLNESVMESTIKIYQASQKLDSMGLVQSRITDLKTTLDLIQKMRQLILEHRSNIENLVSYIDGHKEFIQRKNLEWAFWISKFYQDPSNKDYALSQNLYFQAFEDMLEYTHENFNNIMALQSPKHMANYDAYYLRYRGAADQHNYFNKKRILFQNQFVRAHPEVNPFLPGAHHQGQFKFWDKFSF